MITIVAPLTVVLGAGLFAAGILSFFGIHFFKSKTPERVALAGGLALIVLTEIIFATSGLSTRFLNGQRNDLLECRMETESAFTFWGLSELRFRRLAEKVGCLSLRQTDQRTKISS